MSHAKPKVSPRTLVNPLPLAVKAAGACFLAIVASELAGNPDLVSATFVAVLCTSPTVLTGLNRATAQLVGSLMGGIFGATAGLLGFPIIVGVPLAVAASVWSTLAVRLPAGYAISAFTALFVQIVPRGDPMDTFSVRVLAVLIGGLAGFSINLLVSSRSYRGIFERRLSVAEHRVMNALALAVLQGPHAVQNTFMMLGEINLELRWARDELRWRRRQSDIRGLERLQRRIVSLRHLLHDACEVDYQRLEAGLPEQTCEALAGWLAGGAAGTPPPLPSDLEAAERRLMRQLRFVRETSAMNASILAISAGLV